MPGRFEKPGLSCFDAHASTPKKKGKMVAGDSRTRQPDMNVDVICTFNIGEEEFNGV